MRRIRKELLMILFSVIFLGVYLNSDKITGKFGKRVMNVEVLTMEEIELLCEGKEDVYMESEITLGGGGKIAYDSEQNSLLVPQRLSSEYFDGRLQVPDGKLYFLKDEALKNKAETISENKVLRLFWIRETTCWMYNVFFTGMPVISITSDEVAGEIKNGKMWVYDQYRSTAQFQSAECSWHLRGATTLNYEKSSYRLTLTDRKLSFLGMRKDDDWILHALYDDDGLIHNKFSYEVWREIAASNCVDHDEGISMEFVELFMDNEYLGVYGLSERIDSKALGMNGKDILYKCRDQNNPGEDDFYDELTENMNPVFVWKYPKDFEMKDWEPLKQWVSMFLFEEYDNLELAESILNMGNAVDYNLFNLFTCGMDNIMKNVYFLADYQSNGNYQIIKIPWDLNMTWGNSWIDDPDCNFNRFQEKNFYAEDGWIPDMYRLYEDRPEEIGRLLSDRWQELRRDIVTRENLYEKLDLEFSYLHDSGAYMRNQQKWPHGDGYWQEDYIYEYIDRRIEFLDNYIGQMGKTAYGL